MIKKLVRARPRFTSRRLAPAELRLSGVNGVSFKIPRTFIIGRSENIGFDQTGNKKIRGLLRSADDALILASRPRKQTKFFLTAEQEFCSRFASIKTRQDSVLKSSLKIIFGPSSSPLQCWSYFRLNVPSLIGHYPTPIGHYPTVDSATFFKACTSTRLLAQSDRLFLGAGGEQFPLQFSETFHFHSNGLLVSALDTLTGSP